MAARSFAANAENREPNTPLAEKTKILQETPPKVALLPEGQGRSAPALKELCAAHRFLVISVPSCPQCDELAAFLGRRGVPSSVFVKLDKGGPDYADQKAELQAHAGEKFSFPQVFANGAYQGGFHEVMEKAKVGAFDRLWEEHYDVEPSTVRGWIESHPMVIFSGTSCPQCEVLHSLLEQRGLPVGDITITWDKATPQYLSLKVQMIEILNRVQFSFPQVFIRGEHQGDFHAVLEKLEAGHLDHHFEELFGVKPPAAAGAAAEPNLEAAIGFDEDF